MNGIARLCTASAFLAVAATAVALPRTFGIEQIFSNADGTVQFVVIYDRGQVDCDANENRWAGLRLTGSGAGPTKTYVFPGDLPTCRTSGRSILIATEGFAALGLVAPDYVIPNGFIPFPGGTVAFAGVSEITYAALPSDGERAIDFLGQPVPNVATNLAGQSASVRASPAIANVVEFYHAKLDHYFITWIADEIAKLDDGTAIRGWSRTGASFKAHVVAQPGSSPICRYYIPPELGDSHFFGRGTAECEATGARNPTFVLESASFMHMFLPVAGDCPTGSVPVYRVFSSRPDANHRYMTGRAARDQMVAKGWLAEGDGLDLVVMCAPG